MYAKARQLGGPEGGKESALKTIMGTDWYRLHPAVQARFLHEPAVDEPVLYEGVMEKVHCSKAGWLFAQVTRLIGNPLAAQRGRNVPMQVHLIKRPGHGGVYWQRSYFFERKPFVVTSAKRENAKGQLCEYVGFGFGMRLKTFARHGALHFVSERYFWEVAGVQIPLPHWLSPGRTHVSHTDLGHGRFRFTIAMDHAWLGRTFYQTGVFHRS
jgi:hypothetical protein